MALEHPEARMRRIKHLLERVIIHHASLESYPSLFNWQAEVRFEELVHEMVEGDLRWYAREAAHECFGRYPARRRHIGLLATPAACVERMMSFPLRIEPVVHVAWPSGMICYF